LFGEAAASFAGYTSTPVTGAAGGREAMHAICDASFKGSHLCHISEYILSNSATPIPSGGAWIDYSSVPTAVGVPQTITDSGGTFVGRYIGGSDGQNCSNWTVAGAAGQRGPYLTAGGIEPDLCSTKRVLACCSTVFQEKFRGFTSASSAGNGGGPQGMHARCGAEFPGSHLCHISEYARAAPTTVPPTSGAWLDYSAHSTNLGQMSPNTTMATVDNARYLYNNIGATCSSWTSSSNTGQGLTVVPNGTSSAWCNTTLPLACCE
jgi:hypothetical protein